MLRFLCLRSACISVALFAGSPCFAADGPRFETYVTGEYSGRAADLDTSNTWSPFGPVDQPGLRLKIDSNADIYGYGQASVFSNAFMAGGGGFNALADVMVGYQAHWDCIWLKTYGGAATQSQVSVLPRDGLAVPKPIYGAAAAIEGFWRRDDRMWLSANLSWLQFDNTFSFFGRTGYEVMHADDGKFAISTGLEFGAVVQGTYYAGRRLDLEKDFLKEGALLNIRYWSHELTLSGGFEQSTDDAAWRPYATLSYGKKF